MGMNKVDWYGPNVYSWNPIVMRCSPVSAGCANCWHLRMCDRLAWIPSVENFDWVYEGVLEPVIHSMQRLDEPVRRKKPAIIATQFMGDWMHRRVTMEQIDMVLEVMGDAERHTFLTLTKRPERLAGGLYDVSSDVPLRELGGNDYLPNVWLGVSVEDQATADERIPKLLEMQGWNRWVSIEPMLGPVHLYPSFCDFQPPSWGCGPTIKWVVVGCESGPGRRPCSYEWMRRVIRDCGEANVPCYVKQLDIDSKVSRDPMEWPEDLRVRQTPW